MLTHFDDIYWLMINNKSQSLRISHIFFNKEIMGIYKYFKIAEHEVKCRKIKD